MATAKKRKKKTSTKKEEAMDMITADAQKPEVIAENVTVPKSTPKKKKRAARNLLGDAPGTQTSFKSWFTNKLEQDKRLKAHHLDTIKIYLKGLGIQEGAGPAQYERGLKKYFGEG